MRGLVGLCIIFVCLNNFLVIPANIRAEETKDAGGSGSTQQFFGSEFSSVHRNVIAEGTRNNRVMEHLGTLVKEYGTRNCCSEDLMEVKVKSHSLKSDFQELTTAHQEPTNFHRVDQE